MKTHPIHLFILFVCFIAIQCKKEDKPAKNVPPVVSAGSDRAFTLTGVESADTLVLNGTASDADGTVATYLWSQVSGPNMATFQTPGAASTVARKMIAGTYLFQLTATDDKGAKGTDTVSVTISNPTTNVPPVASAGIDRSIILSGVASSDTVHLKGIAQDSDGSVVAYLWSEISGPNVASIQRPDSATTAIQNLAVGTYLFQFAAIDNKGAKGTDTVSVTVAPLPVNKPPIANAGSNLTIQLPLDSVRLHGTGTDQDGTVITYSWNQISGPALSLIARPDSASTWVKDLVTGTYSYRLRVTDNKGASGYDTVSVSVTAAPVYTHTITLQPNQNVNETNFAVNGTDASDPSSPDLVASAWTKNSVPYYVRGAVKFSLTQIPANSTIVSAKLSLYSSPNPLSGNLVDANYGSNNALLIQRITGSWDKYSTWQNQPSTETVNQVVIPHTYNSFLDLTDVDVTSLITKMYSVANYGFMFKLQNETIYTSRIFCSSKHANAGKRPKLVVTYTNNIP